MEFSVCVDLDVLVLRNKDRWCSVEDTVNAVNSKVEASVHQQVCLHQLQSLLGSTHAPQKPNLVYVLWGNNSVTEIIEALSSSSRQRASWIYLYLWPLPGQCGLCLAVLWWGRTQWNLFLRSHSIPASSSLSREGLVFWWCVLPVPEPWLVILAVGNATGWKVGRSREVCRVNNNVLPGIVVTQVWEWDDPFFVLDFDNNTEIKQKRNNNCYYYFINLRRENFIQNYNNLKL